MSDNNGCGAGFALLAIMVVFIAAMAIGGPVITSGGLSWDNSSALTRERERTERARIQANRDVQIEEERSETARQVAGALAIVGGIAVAGWT
ncbi:MAG: hypothetical protein KAX65_08425, partial [Caldilineaceae bacterium]|nr:hypothetical protein [Caldilineaceae bacterium]